MSVHESLNLLNSSGYRPRTLLNTFNAMFYLYQTSFGQKYDHFSLLCKQMDISLKKKVYIVRKVTSAPTFFGLIQYLST